MTTITLPTDEQFTKEAIEFLLPDPTVRHACLDLLANSIIQAHKMGQAAAVWAVTLASNGGFVRLNVGVIEICAIYYQLFHLCVNKHKLSDSDRDILRSYNCAYGGQLDSQPRVPCYEMWNVPAEKLHIVLPILKLPYESFIEEAASSVLWRTGYYIYHTPSILEYIRVHLSRDIPEPNYDITVAIEHAQDRLQNASSLVERQATIERLKKLRKAERRINHRA